MTEEECKILEQKLLSEDWILVDGSYYTQEEVYNE